MQDSLRDIKQATNAVESKDQKSSALPAFAAFFAYCRDDTDTMSVLRRARLAALSVAMHGSLQMNAQDQGLESDILKKELLSSAMTWHPILACSLVVDNFEDEVLLYVVDPGKNLLRLVTVFSAKISGARDSSMSPVVAVHPLSERSFVLQHRSGLVRVYDLSDELLWRREPAPTPPLKTHMLKQNPNDTSELVDAEGLRSDSSEDNQGNSGLVPKGNSEIVSQSNSESKSSESAEVGGSAGQGQDGIGGTGGQGQSGSGGSGSKGKGGGGGSGSTSFLSSKFDIEENPLVEVADIKPKFSQKSADEPAKIAPALSMNTTLASNVKRLNPQQHRYAIGMTRYQVLLAAVSKQVAMLKQVLLEAEAKEHERTWLKNQTHGELDEARLVDGATGERNVYKRRGTNDPLFGGPQRLPKRLIFLMDCSKVNNINN